MADNQLSISEILGLAAEMVGDETMKKSPSKFLDTLKNLSAEELAKFHKVANETMAKFVNHTVPCIEEIIVENPNVVNTTDLWRPIWTDW